MDLNYQYRWQQFAHRLMDDLVQNPSTTLSGVRILGRKFGVSLRTVERALKQMEDLGIVSPAQHGKRRQVYLRKLSEISAQRSTAGNRILFISPDPYGAHYRSNHIYERLHELSESENFLLSYVEAPLDMAELRALLISLEPCGVFLHMVGLRVEEVVVSLNIPVVGIVGSYSRIACLRSNFSEIVIQAFQKAQAAGHVRISALLWNLLDNYYEMMAAEMEEHFRLESGLSFSRRYNLPSFHGETGEDYHAALNELFRYTPPTCIILSDLSHYLSFASFCLNKGLRIPGDVSIILCSPDPLLECIHPSVAHFIPFLDDIIIQAFHMLQEQMSGFRSCEEIILSPVWVEGNSLTSPKHS